MNTQPEISDSGASAGALVFLRGEKNADFAEINSSLSRQNGVTASFPVLGDWNILMRLAAKDRESLKKIIEEQIRPVKGVEYLDAHSCDQTWTASAGSAEYKAAACAVLDVASGCAPALSTRFRTMAGILECNITDGGSRMILFLRGNSSREIRNFLGGEIRPLPGVLRIKLLNF